MLTKIPINSKSCRTVNDCCKREHCQQKKYDDPGIGPLWKECGVQSEGHVKNILPSQGLDVRIPLSLERKGPFTQRSPEVVTNP